MKIWKKLRLDNRHFGHNFDKIYGTYRQFRDKFEKIYNQLIYNLHLEKMWRRFIDNLETT